MKMQKSYVSPSKDSASTPIKSALTRSKNNLSLFLSQLDGNVKTKKPQKNQEMTERVQEGIENIKF
ncbi:hypothetical protein NUSPORA_00091 [Nucleospora cyclopteri]